MQLIPVWKKAGAVADEPPISRRQPRATLLKRLLLVGLALAAGPFISGHVNRASASGGFGGCGGGNVTYVHDPTGQLIAAVDPNGNAAVYNYDKVGNLLSITNTNCSATSVFGFTPNNGPVGTTVTIYGDGFGTTPSQNTVKFGGVAATVTASTGTTITTSASGFGKITVTSPSGSATSTQSFFQ